jgi:hypothetical protein
VDLSDAINTLNWLFIGGAPPNCVDARDADDDGRADLGDAIFTLTCLFLGGAMIPPPFPACGEDPTEDETGCESYDPCGPAAEGHLVRMSSCGGFGDGGGGEAGVECVSYVFSSGVLKLTHAGAGFNCCGDLSAKISIGDGVIEVAESKPGLCDCECLFDVEYECTGIERVPYLLRFTGSLGGDMEVLADSDDGVECVTRNSYPW